MFASSGPWAAYGFRDVNASENHDKHKHPFLELGFDDPKPKQKG